MSDIPWGPLLITVAVVGGIIVLGLLFALWRKYRMIRSAETPLPAKVAFWGSIAYTVLPIDLLPDPILFDDIGVLLGALTYITTTARKVRRGKESRPG
ncbi:hypothetical protein UO65_0363 [Actinokineospora spheciospongiae]|uniref:DUF1232 domain-containing protein n=1 Tax=Actinokineospora spheciospongiae TaxID=909613 RepID=W7JEB6_9PSEU|nr:DUF1232 domain-containing protein [Actinokineospora spheciospongiae]EWC64319.1 hypothetical protein UO65_0363 [Actinokineospora spheciospongiae]PWW60472.1 uncharacterized protein DUF1232 [Actinokineospora spheciospongiae]